MDLEKLQSLDYAALDRETQLSYRLLEQQLKERIADYQWRHHNYPVNQMFGVHSMVPAFLIWMNDPSKMNEHS